MAANWLDGYYEALKFFYWEPQHIGRKKDVASPVINLEKVMKHLRSMEVTLNHNINQFLLLAPIALRARLFYEFFRRTFDSEFEMHGLGVDTDFVSGNSVQPDFLFVSSGDVISIEMKTKAKSNIDQVLKYALLGLAVEIKLGSPRRHHLGFLGMRDFSKQWKERFASPAELRVALDKADMSMFLKNKGVTFVAQQQRFEAIVAELEVSFLSYRDFAELLKSESPQPSDMSPAAEVYRNLISGLLSEFERRGLCPITTGSVNKS